MINVQVIGISEHTNKVITSEDTHIAFLEDEVQALNAVEKIKPSVILLDYNLRQTETNEYIKLLLGVSKDSKIVVIAEQLKDEAIFACLIAGAKGYQNIQQLSDYSEKMINVIDKGEAWITRRMVAKLLDVLLSVKT